MAQPLPPNLTKRYKTHVNFSKYHGLGNDFILLDLRQTSPLKSAHCITLCDRHRGIGADGVIALLQNKTTLKMHVTNSDGSIPEMCGNGLRCLARYIVEELKLHPQNKPFDIDTDAGIHKVSVTKENVTITFPGPIFDDKKLCTKGSFIGQDLKVQNETYRGTFVSTGNPHFVVMKPVTKAEAKTLGPLLQASPLFPQGANIGFCEIIEEKAIRLVVYERGAGLTQACGTGALGAVSALVKNNQMPADDEVRVRLLGGDLWISVASDYSQATMRGPAEFVFSGTLN